MLFYLDIWPNVPPDCYYPLTVQLLISQEVVTLQQICPITKVIAQP